jgi:YfiH family protein
MDSKTVTWTWEYSEDLPYLTCSLLADFKHGFFTQQFYPRNPAYLTEILEQQARSYRVKQVHGNTVLSTVQVQQQDDLAAADGLFTHTSQESVWVASADCTPVLIADPNTGKVAAVHAGWRGTAQRIVPEAIACLQNQGSQLEDLRIALGPAISGPVYQVTEAVAAEVGLSLVENPETKDIESILARLEAMFNSPIHPDEVAGKVRLDVRRVNELQLEQLGIKSKQMAIAPYCTYQQPEYFFSYRRSKEKKVQWSGIVSNGKDHYLS